MQKPAAAFRIPKFILVLVWLALFLGTFFSLQLPNNRAYTRWQFWLIVPDLLDFVLPAGRAQNVPHSGWEYFPQRFDLIAVAAVILAGAWGAGHLLLRLLRPGLPRRSLDETAFAFGLGLSALSLTTLGCGLAGFLSRPFLITMLACAVAAELGLRYVVDRERVPASTPAGRDFGRPVRIGWLKLALLGAAAPFLLAMLLGSLLPSVDFDVNEYHFEGPKEFFQAGRISFLEHNVYTSFPFGTEMLTLLAMVLRDDWYRGALAGKCALMCFGPLTGLALFAAARRWFGAPAGILAALFYLSTPWIYRISTIAYAEGGLCFYLFATLFALLHCQDAPAMGAARRFALAGLMAGSAMACKYPGFVSVVIPLGLAATWMALFSPLPPGAGSGVRGAASDTPPTPSPAPGGRAGKFVGSLRAVAFVVGVGLAVGPWLLKNACETGNPVYPLAYRIFDGRDWDADLNSRWTKAHSPPGFAPSSLAGLVVDIAMRNDWVSPLLFAFAPLALLPMATRRLSGWLWGYLGWLVLSCWLFTHRIDRFWVPLLPVAALLAGGGAAWWWSLATSKLVRGLIVTLLAAIGLFNLTFMTTNLCGFNAYLLDLDEASRFASTQTVPEIVLLNTRLRPGSKVLSVGDAQVFEARFPLVYNTVFDRSIFEAWFAARAGEAEGPARLRSPEAIRETLADEGITHIYVCWRELVRYRAPGNYGYSKFVTPERFEDLVRLGILETAWQMPNSIRNLDELDPGARESLEKWGQPLIHQIGNSRWYTTFQIYPVNPSIADRRSASD